MGEDMEVSHGIAVQSGEHIQILSGNEIFTDTDGASSICTVILDPSNMTFIPVMPMSEGEEVVMYDIVDDNVKVESPEEIEDVYTEVYTQEVPQTTKSVTKSSRQGPHICKTCNKSFAQVVNLVTHERIHTGEKPFKCSVCTKPFSQQPNLWKHMRIHTGERPYQCVICRKTFTQQANLTKHMRIHTGERPYACHYCGKRFTQQANLTKHVRLHTGERPFHCTYCNKTFVQQSNLERHERTHTGIKPFQCRICSECFAQKAHLCKHLRTVHKNTVNVENYLIDSRRDIKREVIVTECDENEISSDNVIIDECQEIQPTMCIPVLYCTKTGRILRRVD